MRTSYVILICSMVFAATSPAWGGLVTSGLINAHDAALYSGTGSWNDAVTGDAFDAVGTVGSGITHVPADGGSPASMTGFSNCADGDGSCTIEFDTGAGGAVSTGDWTYSMWINKSDPSAGQGGGPGSHAGFIGGGGFSVYQIRAGDSSSGSSLRGEINSGSNTDSGSAHDPPNSGSAGSFPNAPPIFDGNWHLYSLVKSGPNKADVNHYFDGENASVYLGPPGQDFTATANNIDLTGTSPHNINAHRASGRILGPNDKVNKTLFYNRALSPAEIQMNVDAGPNAVVPEPTSLALLGLGGMLMFLCRGRRNRR